MVAARFLVIQTGGACVFMAKGESKTLNPTRTEEAARDSGQFVFVPGNTEAYGRLFARYAPRVKGYMMRRGISPSAAEELTQEVMLTVWDKAERYDAQRAPVRTWVFTIARNRCTDQLRRSMRPAPDPEDPCWVETVHVPTGPEARAMESRREDLLRDALGGLDPDQRETLRKLYFEGQTTSEAAEALGVPVGTIKSRTRRALQALRKRLGDGGIDGA